MVFDLDGIIGLDLLTRLKSVINVDELTLHSNTRYFLNVYTVDTLLLFIFKMMES